MMRSFGQLTQDYLTITGDDGSANKTLGQTLINETDKIVQALRPWQFLETTQSITTTDDGATYELHPLVGKVLSVRASTSDGEPMIPVSDPDMWERLQSYDTSASDYPTHYRVIGGQLHVYPSYDSAGDTLVVRYKKTRRDLTGDDYTTGTITSVANGAKAVVGSGTTWQKATSNVIAGSSWIQFSGDNGDDLWYEIASVDSTTALTLQKNYAGASIAAATDAYRIGQMSLIPGGYHQLLLLRPLAMYFQQHENTQLANQYWRQYDGGYEVGLRDTPGGLLGQMIENEDFDDSPFVSASSQRDDRNVNDPPTNLSGF